MTKFSCVAASFMAAILPSAFSLESGAGSLRGAEDTIMQGGVHVERRIAEDPTGGSYEHVGCFLDEREDRVLSYQMKNDEMTPMLCHEHCDSMAAAYMALQFGTECFCSIQGRLEYERHGWGEFGECDMYCAGSTDLVTCGGRYAFDLYQLSWPASSTSEEYIQCFADLRENRVMEDMMIMSDMTEAMCREHCVEKEARFYGLQYGNECWCGHSSEFIEYETYGPGVCHMPCGGDPEVACGGFESFSLFEISGSGDDDDFTVMDDNFPVSSSSYP